MRVMIRLIIAKPDKPPESVLYDKPIEVTIGRSSRCAIVLNFDPLVSRTHAAFLLDPLDPPSARIKDLHSTNGIRINGEFLGPDSTRNAYDPVALRNGDEVRIGSTLFTIELPEPDPGATTDIPPALARDALQSGASSRRSAARDGGSSGRYGADETVFGMEAPLPRIPGYRLTRYLAQGTAGKVYLGVSNGDNRLVAVKTMYPPSGLTPELLRVFFREFDDARHIVHPRLARLLGAGELPKGGGVFLTAEYAEGEELSLYMRRRPGERLPPGIALDIAAQIAGALCRVHARGMAHLDLKPSSVIVREDGDGRIAAKVTDAGFTVFPEMAGLSPPAHQALPGFLAPERLTPEKEAGKEAGKAADVFSLCALLFFMIAGTPPYAPGGADGGAGPEKGEAFDPGRLPGGTPEALAAVMRKGLRANPDERFADACGLAAALEAGAGGKF